MTELLTSTSIGIRVYETPQAKEGVKSETLPKTELKNKDLWLINFTATGYICSAGEFAYSVYKFVFYKKS